MTGVNKGHDQHYGNIDSQHLKQNTIYGTNRKFRF